MRDSLNEMTALPSLNKHITIYNSGLDITTIDINGRQHHVVKHIDIPKKPAYSFIKRLFDIVTSLLCLIIFAIPMLVIAICIKIDSPGPVIFRQSRVGWHGKEFTLYKFRSMINDAETNGIQWAEIDDPRCTSIGRLLRKIRMDELPQLFNILRGELSFVGPRPERRYFYHQFSEYIEGFDQRIRVKPGLTGWAQVNGGYNLKPEEKIVFDIEYIKKRSILMDIKCLLKTLGVLFNQNGAR